MAEPARSIGPFERATREALEAEVSRPVAEALLARALVASRRDRVPEEIVAFRAFVEGALCIEMSRVLDPNNVSLVLTRLGNVLWMATSDVRALSVARDWSDRRHSSAPPQSGSHPRVPLASERPMPSKPLTMPMPARAMPAPAMPAAAMPAAAMPRPSHAPHATRAPSCVLVLSLDAKLVAQTTTEVAGRCPVVGVATPSGLARAVSHAGDRPVVLVDTALASIDLPTFVGLTPILPAGARVILWGVDATRLARVAAQFPRAGSWIASADARGPGLLALSV